MLCKIYLSSYYHTMQSVFYDINRRQTHNLIGKAIRVTIKYA